MMHHSNSNQTQLANLSIPPNANYSATYDCGGIVNYGGIEGSIGATSMTFTRVAQAVPRPCSDGMETFNTSSSHGCATTGRFRVA